MIILIDGVEGSGKTSVCRFLSKKIGYPIVKMPNMKTYFKRGLSEEFSKLFNETIVQFKDYPFILDRGFVSSIVYSKVFKRDFDLSYIGKIEKELNCCVFILTANERILKSRRPNDKLISSDLYKKIDREYRKIAKSRKYILIDTSNKSIKDICEEIIKKL